MEIHISDIEFARLVLTQRPSAVFSLNAVCTSPGWGVQLSVVDTDDEVNVGFFPYHSQDENDPWEEAEEFILEIISK